MLQVLSTFYFIPSSPQPPELGGIMAILQIRKRRFEKRLDNLIRNIYLYKLCGTVSVNSGLLNSGANYSI
jgi:hypothetical protein